MPGQKQKLTKGAQRDTGNMFRAMRAVIAGIPRCRVATYGQIAELAGFPGAARQAAWALRDSRGLPWHRVLAAGGRIALTGVHGLEQRTLLEFEGVKFRGRKVRMDLHGWNGRRDRGTPS